MPQDNPPFADRMEILDGQALERQLRQPIHEQRGCRLIADNVLKCNIAELRSCLCNCKLLFIVPFRPFHSSIEQMEGDRLVENSVHADIFHLDILHYAASATGAFEPQADVRADEQAVSDPDGMYTAGHLAADYYAAVSMIHGTMADGNIPAGHRPSASLLILS
ncbi:hypothetical protein D3C75_611300 [compost metagenome]